MNTMDSYYFGMIKDVYKPTDPENYSKYQYEYNVLVTGDGYASIPCRCIRKDPYGSQDDFEDTILDVATKVMVRFPRGDRSLGIIESGTRAYVAPQDPALGRHWRNRFNKLVRFIDKDGNYSVTSDQGPNLQVRVDKIVLDDSVGESITLDKASNTIIIKSKTLNFNVTGDVTMTVGGNLTANVSGDMTAKAGGKADIEAGGDCKIKASKVSINGESGKILTTVTDPVVDSIFGEPTMGVDTVSSG